MEQNENTEHFPEEPVTITDKRRLDPETGHVREDATSAGSEGESPSEPADASAGATTEAGASQDATKIEELTNDLRRAHADFENFRRRTERDRNSTIEHAKASVVSELLVILDDLDRAQTHGDLADSPLKPIADKLTSTLHGLGLEKYGAVGEPFDPALHEAVQNEGSGADPVISTVYRSGYKYKDRVLRTAMVVVSTEDNAPEQHTESASDFS